MLAKLITFCCACAAALAAPGIYGGVPALAPAYAGHGFAGYAAPAYASYAAPVLAKQVIPAAIAAPVIAKQVLPTAIAAPVIHAEPVDPNPAYQFSYGVSDPSTGDQKDASESLQNGVVHGSYSLVEPDGHLRRVTYTADKINGFNAVVERTGGAHAAPLAVAPVAKVLAPAPVAVAAPISRLTLPAIGHPWG